MNYFRIIGMCLSLVMYIPVKLLWGVSVILFRVYCEISRFGTNTSGPVEWNAFDVSTRFHDGWWS